MDILRDTIKSTPLMPDPSVRTIRARGLTSAPAGKMVPLWAEPLLREDRVQSGRFRVTFDAAEMVRTPMNAIGVRVHVHFVPFLAFDRFEGSLDRLNRSYKGEPDKQGGTVVPFFNTVAYNRDSPFWKTLGIHAVQGSNVNASYMEAYNVLWNYRAQARSTKIAKRGELDGTLAPAFWPATSMSKIVPDFDEAAMDGEVTLDIAAAQLPVVGIGLAHPTTNPAVAGNMRETGKTSPTALTRMTQDNNATTPGTGRNNFAMALDANAYPAIFAELGAQNVKLSLANIELAKRTAAFAELRKQYAGLDDDFIIDLLMQGIRVPDAQLAQPILLDRKSTIFGYTERFATDAANLDEHVTTGITAVELSFRTPPMNTGGVILITAEIVPEQLFERAADYFLQTTAPGALPDALRDYLDPQKVSVVPNRHVDVLHSNPTGTFGYAPLNHEWNRDLARIGGKFMRQPADPFNEDRQRIWAIDKLNPTLTTDFYTVGTLPNTIFADTLSDPFEVVTLGSASIVGLTQFGKGLSENTNDYAEIMQDVDTGRIEQA